MGDINITNNFNAPIGQHIDHVDTIDFHMDGEGNFQFGMVEQVNQNECTQSDQRCQAEDAPAGRLRQSGESYGYRRSQNPNANDNDEELFHFIHPSMDEEQEKRIHNEVKQLVKRQGIQMICQHLAHMQNEGKLLLPPNPSVVYNELGRMGMPQNEGYNENTFRKYYSNR